MPYDFTGRWNLKNKTNEQRKPNQTKLLDTEDRLVIIRREGVWAK